MRLREDIEIRQSISNPLDENIAIQIVMEIDDTQALDDAFSHSLKIVVFFLFDVIWRQEIGLSNGAIDCILPYLTVG